MAMAVLGLGLHAASHHEYALSVGEAELSTARRLGASEENIAHHAGQSCEHVFRRLDGMKRLYDEKGSLFWIV